MAAETVIPYDEAISILVDHAVTATGNHLYDWNAAFSGLNPVEVAERLHTFGIGGAVSQNGQVFFHYDSPYLNATVNDVMSSANSNLSKTYSATMNPVLESTIDATTGKVSMAQKVVGAKKFFFGKVVPAIAATSAGLSLGKSIDERLYNSNPDFWDAHGMSTLNPETWSSIASGNELGETLINFIFGIDGSGNTQAYMDETAYAYMAQYMSSINMFDSSYMVPESYEYDTTINWNSSPEYFLPLHYITSGTVSWRNRWNELITVSFDGTSAGVALAFVAGAGDGTWYYGYSPFFVSTTNLINAEPKTFTCLINGNSHTYTVAPNTSNLPSALAGRFAYWSSDFINPNVVRIGTVTGITPTIFKEGGPDSMWAWWQLAEVAYLIAEGGSLVSPYEGIGSQSGATLPSNYNTWVSPESTLTSLQSQYPELWQNAVPVTTLQPDGTTTTTQYIPVPLPNATSYSDTQPVSGDETQTSTQTTTDTMTAIKTLLTDLIATPTDNPPDTGSGSSPTPVPIASTASSLWAIYHPTQEQVDAFGAWLWSDNLISQIKALMFSPIDSVISLHKIYCTPIDMGESTIQLGYLNSEVPSNYVTQQYVYTSCGSVNVSEYFGNVFDYSPNTTINLYLPFIGIVPLDVDSVMRSTMHIVYGVDIITGDCLATVNIHRDGYNSVQYQYSGNCSVHYPLTAGNYMSLLSSSLSGAISGFIGGGSIAAAAGGALGGAMRSGTDVRRSGNFSGNAGAMGGKIPYLIIERPQTKVADNFEHYQGYPTNAYVTVGDCSGYIRASTLHTDGIAATDNEIDMIRDAFSQGVIV